MGLTTATLPPHRHEIDQQTVPRLGAGHPARILGIGIATLDIINQVERYPAEDDEVRALSQHIARGGNCANTLAVLSEFGHHCHWAGTLANDSGAEFIRQDLSARGIALDAAKTIPGSATPTSYITLSRATGSRTIVHHRDLPELSAADLARTDLGALDWVHLEGRNPTETARMLARIASERPDLPISVELEKPRPGIEALFQLPETAHSVLIIARAFAEQQGAQDPHAFLQQFAKQSNASLLLLPWGAAGAYALTRKRELLFAPAQPPAAIIDTIAAGDVFNAAAIAALLDHQPIDQVLRTANALAGHSCGQLGIDGLIHSARIAGVLPTQGLGFG
ncbi:MAG: PfkB family carbohydrate kinase [Halochromatium sp.]